LVKIAINTLLNPTQRTIKNVNRDFRTSDGPNTSNFLDLSDLAIPYDSQYVSRIILPSGTNDFLLNYGLLNNCTFLLIKVVYNGNYDYPNEDDYDPYYNQEPSNYNITYYYDGNSGLTYPIGRLLILNGSFTNKIGKIYLNNSSGNDVALEILCANIEEYKPIYSSSATTISNMYYSDIITNQVVCTSTGFTGSTTGSTQFIISQFKPSLTGYTIVQYTVPYNTIISIMKDISINTIYLSTTTQYYTLKFLTQFDCNQAYSRMLFAYISYSGGSCRFLTVDNAYDNGVEKNC